MDAHARGVVEEPRTKGGMKERLRSWSQHALGNLLHPLEHKKPDAAHCLATPPVREWTARYATANPSVLCNILPGTVTRDRTARTTKRRSRKRAEGRKKRGGGDARKKKRKRLKSAPEEGLDVAFLLPLKGTAALWTVDAV